MFTNRHANRRQRGEEPRCSFCNKNQSEVRKFIAGPAVYICDECVRVCVDLLGSEPDADAEAREHERAETSVAPAPRVGPVSAPCLVCQALTPTAGLLWLPDRGPVCFPCAADIEQGLVARASGSKS